MVTEKRRYRVMHGGHGTAAGPVPACGFADDDQGGGGPVERSARAEVRGSARRVSRTRSSRPSRGGSRARRGGTVTGRFPATLGGE